MNSPVKVVSVALMLLVIATAFPARADTLQRVADAGTFTIGYRADARPFSFADANGLPAGYSVALCERIAVAVGEAAGRPGLEPDYELVTAASRFAALEDGTIDLLCGATTVTLARRERIDFSLLTFATGAAVLVERGKEIDSLGEIAGRRIGVLGGTTTEEGLRSLLAERAVAAEVVAVADHPAGLAALEAGEIDAYFGDRILLIGLAMESDEPDALQVSDRFFSYEPYALALRRDDDALRLVADRTLAALYRSGEIAGIYRRWFGGAEPSDLLRALFVLHALPE